MPANEAMRDATYFGMAHAIRQAVEVKLSDVSAVGKRRLFSQSRSGVGNTTVKDATLDRVIVVARSQLGRLACENSDVPGAGGVEIFHPPSALKLRVDRQSEVTRFKWS
jgi:hypothetical protein